MQFHRLSKSKDPNFWSVRVGCDLRLIVHKTASSPMLCYVDHHEEVYQTERHLLYVACTRARDYVLVSGVKRGSEFLEDMRREPSRPMTDSERRKRR